MDFPPQQPRLVAENGLSFRITDVQSINWASDEDEEAAEEGGGHRLLLLHFSIVSSNTKRSLSFAEPYEWSLNSLDRSKLEAKGVSEKLFFIKKVILG
ncbi:unnamed protein product [Prunus armeniaca]|uniref:Uncharacterized protein n=1 Tax=Prunus armeniaca TaxID=36596 RepID=A0A6J5TXE8_PRUAR|nr:unnamed protein product [Prunus armeniaca]